MKFGGAKWKREDVLYGVWCEINRERVGVERMRWLHVDWRLISFVSTWDRSWKVFPVHRDRAIRFPFLEG